MKKPTHPSRRGSDVAGDLDRISRCVKCGSCSSVCPSFQLSRRESFSPRGRMALVRAVLEGRLPLTGVFEDRLDTCASCLACEAVCASAVPVTQLIQSARELAVAEAGAGLIKNVLAAALKNAHAMKASVWLAPLVLHYGRGTVRPDRNERRRRAGSSRTSRRKKGESLILFPGCSVKYYQPGLGEDAAAVLDLMGYDVIVPEGLSCCGRSLLSLGDRKGAEEAARHNRSLLSGFGRATFVTACASCALTFKKEYPKLLGPSGDMPEILDIHEVLAARIDRLSFVQSPRTITWHDPCHLGRGQGLAKTARRLLQAVPGVTLLEMKDPDRCCGFGGVMRATHRDISDGILEQKVRNILSTGAEAIVTGCPSCRTQIADGLRRSGSSMEVLHTVQLVAQAIKKEDHP